MRDDVEAVQVEVPELDAQVAQATTGSAHSSAALTGPLRDPSLELRRLDEQLRRGVLNQLACGEAAYREGEVHRLRGEFAIAEGDYRTASGFGREPQPGHALMRLAQGNLDSAAATIRRAVSESSHGLPRVALLPAYVEVMLAVGDVDAAGACREFDEIAAQQDSEAIELQAAHRTFAELGANPDLAALEALTPTVDSGDVHGLSLREREVLRLVATGLSNREISTALFLSEHTVARHLQNIFAKLGVSSRTAASAFAYKHDLV